jgi:hypothetical protein
MTGVASLGDDAAAVRDSLQPAPEIRFGGPLIGAQDVVARP